MVELARRDTPACWSWPVPDVRPEAEVAELLARHQLPPQICSNAVSGPAAAWRFVEFHAGRCAVCGDVVALLVVDHKHGPRTVRGCLCYGCNMLEGSGGRDLPIFVGYRREHPALMLGYYEPFRGNGASQRVLRAVHATSRAQRYCELRVADVTRWVRDLAKDPDIRADKVLSRTAHQLDLRWRKVVQGHQQATPGLIHDLAQVYMYLDAIADWDLGRPFEGVYLRPMAALIARLRREYAQMMGQDPGPIATRASTGSSTPPFAKPTTMI